MDSIYEIHRFGGHPSKKQFSGNDDDNSKLGNIYPTDQQRTYTFNQPTGRVIYSPWVKVNEINFA